MNIQTYEQPFKQKTKKTSVKYQKNHMNDL